MFSTLASALFAHENASASDPPATQQTSAAAGLEAALRDLNLSGTFTETSPVAWAMLLTGIFGGLAAGKLLQHLLRTVATRLKARGADLRGTGLLSAAGPIHIALLTFGIKVGLSSLAMAPSLRAFCERMVSFFFALSAAWFIYNLVDLIEVILRQLTSRTETKLDDQIVPIVRKTLRIFVVIVCGLFVAEDIFGADITAWLAGLGIAGLGVSLAAQDSIKNLFGSATIFLERPFTVGETIICGGHEGTVEEIGFRSIKLRTYTGHLVTIPNSKIVDSTIENIQRRPSIRRLLDVSLTYDTPPEKIEEAVRILIDILAEPEMAAPFDLTNFPPRIVFHDLGVSGLSIRVLYWFFPNDYWLYMAHAQKFNLKLLRAFNEAGIEFAFPTQTIYLARDQKRPFLMKLSEEDTAAVA